LNPGSPAPQASILIQSRASGTRTQGPDSLPRLRARTQGILHEDRIINTLLQMKNSGLSEATLATASLKLNQLGRHADLQNPQEILPYIANSTVSNAMKQKLANDYNYYCITNQINWKKPTHRWERKIPLIPTTENIYKIKVHQAENGRAFSSFIMVRPVYSPVRALLETILDLPPQCVGNGNGDGDDHCCSRDLPPRNRCSIIPACD
jgi:hypothetical protein